MNDGLKEAEGRGPTRNAPRDSLFLMTELMSPDGIALGKARVRNLSATGMMIECDAPLAKGTRLAFDLRGVGEVQGAVAWIRSDRIGIAFDTEIDPQRARKPVGQGKQEPLPPHLRGTGTQFRR
jgi:hypothetical protein